MVNYNMFKEAKSLAKKGKYEKAYFLFKELHEYEPKNKEIIYEYAKSASAIGYLDFARELLELLVPDKFWYISLYELAKIDIKEDKIDAAIEKLNEVLYINPYDYFSIYELAKLEYRFGDKNKAITELNKLISTDLADMALIFLAGIDYEENRLDAAENKYKEILKNYKSYLSPVKKYRCYSTLARIKLEKNEEKEAIKYFEKARECRYVPGIEINLAKLYAKYGREDEAIEIFKLVYEKDKDYENSVALFELGIIYYNKKEYEEALLYFNRIQNTEKFREGAKLYIAKIYNYLGKYNDSKEIYMQLLTDYDNKFAAYELIKIMLASGDLEDAHDLLNKQLKKEYNDKLYFQLAKCKQRLGLYNESEKIFKELLQTSLASDVYKELSFLLIHQKKYSEAFDYLKKELNENKNHSYEVYNAITYLKFMLGKIDHAYDEVDSYFTRQLDCYDENLAIEHIKLHCTEDEEKALHTMYYENVDIKKAYYEACKKIKNINPIISNFVDKYIVEFDYPVGEINNLDTNELLVVTYPNTKNIISMYPFSRRIVENEYNEYVQQKEEKPKKKTLSRVEKFNKKYGFDKK